MKIQSTAAAAFGPDDLARASGVPDGPAGHTEPSAALSKLIEAAANLDTRPPVSPVVLGGITRLAECGLMVLAGAPTLAWTGLRAPAWVVAVLAMAGSASAGWYAMRLYKLQVLRAPGTAIRRMVPVLIALSLIAVGCAHCLGRADMDQALALWLVTAAVAVVGGRQVATHVVRHLTRLGRLERRTVVVGGGKPGADLLEALALQSDPDLRIFGVFDDRNDARSPMILAGYPKLGNVSDLVSFARRTRVDLIVFTLPITAEARLLQMLQKLWVLPIDIRLAAHRSGLKFRPHAYSYVGGVPVLDMFDKPIADWDVILKAVFDRVVGTLAILAMSPVLLLTALAIKLDSPGPIFFKQLRHGFNNEPVEVLKFRSLYADKTDHTAARQVTKDDPRVTRVGRFIRKTSLDELPQLFNVVFKGNLSLVGPRPHAVHARIANKDYNDVVDGYFARHRVKPGITGWAQVNGWRGETDTPEKIQKRVEHDLAYIESWSIWFDIYILAVTPLALTRTENAY